MNHPTLQLVLRPGILDLGWGHPDSALMPLDGMRMAAAEALDRFGADLFAYGHSAGAGPLLGWLQERIARTEGRMPETDGIAITGGSSLGLDQICTLLTKSGDIALVESPTYHYAVKILRDHPLELVPVAADQEGIQIDALEATLAQLRSQGRTARMLYSVPTFHNPTGACLSAERRHALINLAERAGFLIVEDDVYRDLAYHGDPPPSLWSMDANNVVLRLGSFAKSLAPGMRLGWMTGAPELVRRIAEGGVLDSGGGANHYAAMHVAAFCLAGRFEPHVARLRNAYAERSAALASALHAELSPECTIIVPGGGFFTWVHLPAAVDANALLQYAEASGVAFIPGARFFIGDGGRSALRLAHSLYGPTDLVEAAARLGHALKRFQAA